MLELIQHARRVRLACFFAGIAELMLPFTGACNRGLATTGAQVSVPSQWTQPFLLKLPHRWDAWGRWAVNGVMGGSPTFGIFNARGLQAAPRVLPTLAGGTISAVGQENPKSGASVSAPFSGVFAYVTNQLGASVSAYRIDAGGNLVPLDTPSVPTGENPYALAADPTGSYLYVTAGTDFKFGEVYIYAINPQSGALTQVGPPTRVGSGARSLKIAPWGTALYVPCLNGKGIYAFSIDPGTGALKPLPGSPFPNLGQRPAAIAFSPSGALAFVANNASHSVTVFSVDPASGRLTPRGTGSAAGMAPIWAGTDASGAYLYILSDGDDSIYGFSVARSGELAALSPPASHGVADPLSAALSPNGRFLYVPNWSSSGSFPANSVSVFSIDADTGELSAIQGSPFATGTGPASIAFEPTGRYAYVTNELAETISTFSVNPSTGAMTFLSQIRAGGRLPTTISIVSTNP